MSVSIKSRALKSFLQFLTSGRFLMTVRNLFKKSITQPSKFSQKILACWLSSSLLYLALYFSNFLIPSITALKISGRIRGQNTSLFSIYFAIIPSISSKRNFFSTVFVCSILDCKKSNTHFYLFNKKKIKIKF